jgi:hypothetical protein
MLIRDGLQYRPHVMAPVEPSPQSDDRRPRHAGFPANNELAGVTQHRQCVPTRCPRLCTVSRGQSRGESSGPVSSQRSLTSQLAIQGLAVNEGVAPIGIDTILRGSTSKFLCQGLARLLAGEQWQRAAERSDDSNAHSIQPVASLVPTKVVTRSR